MGISIYKQVEWEFQYSVLSICRYQLIYGNYRQVGPFFIGDEVPGRIVAANGGAAI